MFVATKLLASNSTLLQLHGSSLIHDWIDHMETTNQQVELIAPKEVANKCLLTSFKFHPTKEFPTGFCDVKTGTNNIRTPWW
ncbi:hypothetical protein GOBAR_DD18161 [Gossypium barbadense]|nr:hypothetical protein GOBAR_DD18161 [Gossypium barbadense]